MFWLLFDRYRSHIFFVFLGLMAVRFVGLLWFPVGGREKTLSIFLVMGFALLFLAGVVSKYFNDENEF